MKSAYELALEKLEQQGIAKPREEALGESFRARASEIRQKAKATLAELEILHRDRLAKLGDPAALEEEQQEYVRERTRIEDRCARDIRQLREQ